MSDFENAACSGIDTEIFFPGRGESTIPAQEICQTCEIQTECLQMALDEHINVGVYGGASQKQRRTIRALGLTAEQAMELGIVE